MADTGICTAHLGRHERREDCVQWDGSEETRLREELEWRIQDCVSASVRVIEATARATDAESALADMRAATDKAHDDAAKYESALAEARGALRGLQAAAREVLRALINEDDGLVHDGPEKGEARCDPYAVCVLCGEDMLGKDVLDVRPHDPSRACGKLAALARAGDPGGQTGPKNNQTGEILPAAGIITESAPAPAGEPASSGQEVQSIPWRQGRKVPQNVYEGDKPIAQFHDAETAARVVAAVNATPPPGEQGKGALDALAEVVRMTGVGPPSPPGRKRDAGGAWYDLLVRVNAFAASALVVAKAPMSAESPDHAEQGKGGGEGLGMVVCGDGNHAVCMDKADPFHGWVMWRHPDGQWVSERKATPEEMARTAAHVKFTEAIGSIAPAQPAEHPAKEK